MLIAVFTVIFFRTVTRGVRSRHTFVRSTVKIQFWNLGFVDAYQNSILRGQALST